MTTTIIIIIIIIIIQNCTCLSVNVVCAKVLIEDTISTPRCRAKAFSVIFETLSIGPASGLEPATFRSAVKHSTD